MSSYQLLAVLAAVAAVFADAVPNGARAQGGRVIPQGELSLPKQEGYFRRPRKDRVFRGAALARANGNIRAAWFSDPTDRYRHNPFGGRHHPATLTVSTSDLLVLRLPLPKDSVFEDRKPRIVDVDGDGRDEVVVIRGYLHKGAALAVAVAQGRSLAIIAETPPIGRPFRWLNPAGFADFDGDGKTDIALVVTPHIGGILQIWTYRERRLIKLGSLEDVSNHVMGSLHMDLSAVADFNADGIADLAIPSADRRRLRFISFAGGRMRELGSVLLRARASESFAVASVDGQPAAVVGLSGGRKRTIVPCREIYDWELVSGRCW